MSELGDPIRPDLLAHFAKTDEEIADHMAKMADRRIELRDLLREAYQGVARGGICGPPVEDAEYVVAQLARLFPELLRKHCDEVLP